MLKLRLGQGEEALRTIKDAKRLFPASAEIRETYGLVRRYQAKAALRRTRLALRGDPQLEHFLRASDLLRTLGRFAKARGYLARAANRYPEHWGVHLTLAKLYWSRFREQGRRSDSTASLDELRHAYTLNPHNYQILLYLAIVTSHLDLLNESRKAAQAILFKVPNDPKALGILSHVERRLSGAGGDQPLPDDPVAAEDGGEDKELPPEATGDSVAAVDGEIAALASLPGVRAVLTFGENGSPASSSVRDKSSFDVADAQEAAKSMIAECRFDANNLGIGEFQSCYLAGDSWQVYMFSHESGHAVVFGNEAPSGPTLDVVVDDMLAKVPAI
jgi:hypothetical protein